MLHKETLESTLTNTSETNSDDEKRKFDTNRFRAATDGSCLV